MLIALNDLIIKEIDVGDC